MAVRHERITVTASATALLGLADQSIQTSDIERRVVLQNSSTVEVHLGGDAGVTTNNSGHVIPANGTLTLELTSTDKLFGITAATTSSVVRLLHLGV